MEQDIVFLYFFDANDGRSTEEKIVSAAKQYAKANRISTLFDPVIHRTKAGKPYIAGHTEIGVSVSHSGDWFVCALTEGNVGVDIEQHKRAQKNGQAEIEERFVQIAKRFFHPEEAAYVAQSPMCRFYMVWTAKESYVKYTGTGMNETFGERSVVSAQAMDEKSYREGLPIGWIGEDVCFKQMLYEKEYTLCVCKENTFDIEFIGMR